MRARCDDCDALFEIEVPRELEAPPPPLPGVERVTVRGQAAHSPILLAQRRQPAILITSPAATTRLSWHHSASIALQRRLIDFGPIGACSDRGGNCGDVTSLTA